jgi:hypothetical protein
MPSPISNACDAIDLRCHNEVVLVEAFDLLGAQRNGLYAPEQKSLVKRPGSPVAPE